MNSERFDVDELISKADHCFQQTQDWNLGIQFYQAAISICESQGDWENVASLFLKMGIGLPDSDEYATLAIESFKHAADLLAEHGRQEQASQAAFNAGIASSKRKDLSRQTIGYFRRAAQGFEIVANEQWKNGEFDYAWDNSKLASVCWRNALSTLEAFFILD